MKNKIIFILIFVLVMTLVLPMNVSAASGISEIDEFKNITEGDGQYIKYADNYHLDIKKVGIMDKDKEMLNNVANFFFGVFKNFSYLSIVIFYHCFTFDISEMFGSELNGIQSALRNLLFNGGIFLIVFATTAFYIVNQLIKGDIQGILNEVLKVVAILIISMMVTTQSDTFLSFVNTTTKQVSVEALGGISGQSLSSTDSNASIKRYAADASGMLWSGLVHKPWVALEFGDHAESNTENILRLSINSDDRKALIENLYESNGLFAEDVGAGRLTTAFFMALPIMLKCIFYLLIALLQMFFQVFTLFYIILCPVVLLLAVSPQLGSTELIWFWLKKVIETQLSILILTFVIGLIVKFDAILANWNNVGWLVGLYLQIFVMAALVLNWQKVLVMMSRATRSIQNPRLALAMRQMRQGGGMYVNTINGAVHGAQQLGSLANAAGLGAAGLAGGAGTALMGGISGAWDSLADNYIGKSNYNNVQQYQPRTAPPPPPSPGSPAPANISDAARNERVNANANADAVSRQSKVIDYNKIPRYKEKSSASAAPPQTARYKMAANGEDLQGANKINAQTTERPYTINYNAKAAHYTTTNKTPSEAAQGPRSTGYTQNKASSEIAPRSRTAEYAQKADKGATQAKAPQRSPQPAASAKPASGSQSFTGRNTSILSNTQQFNHKPVVENFEFKTQEAPQRTINANDPPKLQPKRVPIAKPKPVVEQFNFKVHTAK